MLCRTALADLIEISYSIFISNILLFLKRIAIPEFQTTTLRLMQKQKHLLL